MGFNLDNTGDTGATGASFIDTLFQVVDVLDGSKKVKFDVTGTTGTTLFLKTQQTANRTLTFPDITDTLVSRTSTDTLTNKTMSGGSNTFSNISLTTAVTGILPIANGGTNSNSVLNNNRIMTSVGGAIVENSALTASAPMRTNASGLPTTGTINLSTETSGTISLTTQVSGTLPIANGGTGQTTKSLAFDALSPMTTIGDIIYGGASGTGTRLANGTSGQFLGANTGAAPSWQNININLQVSAVKTTTYSILTTDNLVLTDASGGSFTVTLPTAVGVTGKYYTIKRVDQTPTNAVTIATTSSQTIDGVTTRKLSTQYEQFTVVSDGSNWQIWDHSYPSVLQGYTPTLTGFGTATNVSFKSTRVGDRLKIFFTFKAGTPTAVVAQMTIGFGGSNANVTIDTSKLSSDGTIVGSYALDTAGGFSGYVVSETSNSTTVKMGLASSSPSLGGFTYLNGNSIAAVSSFLSGYFEVPIVGWEG